MSPSPPPKSIDWDDISKRVQAEHERFQNAIGQMTLAWADTESALYAILRFYSGVSTDIGRAIFSGLRARPMMDFISNIAHNTNMDAARRSDLEAAFSQLKALNTMRDRIVHHVDGSMIEYDTTDPEQRSLTNLDRVSRKGTGFNYKIGSSTINDMVADMKAICWHLLAHRDANPFEPWKDSSGKTHNWRFKAPQPSQPSKS